MWVMIDAGLATRSELEHLITLDEYMSATEYLAQKIETQQRAQKGSA